MADEADFANDLMAEVIERAVAARVTFYGVSAAECEECSADIPVKRQRALPGVRVCVACAEVADINRAGVRRG